MFDPRVVLMVFVSAISTQAYCQPLSIAKEYYEPQTLAYFKLRGPVKSVQEDGHTHLGEYNDEVDSLQLLFNSQGYLVEQIRTPISAEKSVYLMQYDSVNHLIHFYVPGSDYSDYRNCTFTYNAKGNIVKLKVFWTKHFEYLYDRMNRLIGAIECKSDGTKWKTWEYEYDASGNLVKEYGSLATDPDHVFNINEFEYDEQGNLIRSETCSAASSFALRCYRESMRYDDRNRLKTKTDYAGISFRSITVISYVYNDHDDIAELNTMHPDGTSTLLSYEYEYDDQLNWVRKVALRNGKASRVTVRRIQYFE